MFHLQKARVGGGGCWGTWLEIPRTVLMTEPHLPLVVELAEPQGAEKTGKKGKEQTQAAQRNAHEELATMWHGATG